MEGNQCIFRYSLHVKNNPLSLLQKEIMQRNRKVNINCKRRCDYISDLCLGILGGGLLISFTSEWIFAISELVMQKASVSL